MPTEVGFTVTEPLPASEPVQLPDAVQLVASTDDQVSVTESPMTMELLSRLRVGAAGGGITVKSTELIEEAPRALEQFSEYVLVPPALGVTVKLPRAASVPLQLPEAVQLAAFVEDHEMTDDAPRLMEPGCLAPA